MPDLIETRPFTIHAELYAWPSYRIFTERVLWVYVLLMAVVSVLAVVGLHMNVGLGIVTGLILVGVAFGMSFARFKKMLSRPDHRRLFQNCIVSLTDESLRQDYPDDSYMEFKLFAITAFRDLGDFYFVFATPRNGIVVPKTAFESIEQSREFANKIQSVLRSKR